MSGVMNTQSRNGNKMVALITSFNAARIHGFISIIKISACSMASDYAPSVMLEGRWFGRRMVTTEKEVKESRELV